MNDVKAALGFPQMSDADAQAMLAARTRSAARLRGGNPVCGVAGCIL